MHIDAIINQIYPLPPHTLQLLKTQVSEVSHPKGHILLRANRVEQVMYFIKKGIVRAYSEYEDNEITFWFGKEGDPVLSMKSYVLKEKGYEHIELLEDCELYEIEVAQLEALFHQDIHIANWGRRLAEKELIKTEERFISRQCRTATERYKELMNESPHLLQRVQLGHIASYLGITQVSLSRIRAEIR
ncbi:cAMP-binding domain of CRP or a regulatory subunit of cAMP-dependent protein kinases [Filimonas lacunae]|uniref:cAMP-binding domain of CRP or a regulatory subunit of cAMP-dependent protein kinases n=1 Tax=Filimonas lacunae TaxID=477680 RepID=A0A173MIQ8_9BACT|nr:Crp/Fnr family transcriptional regulator [Filimonas lacunae]BAV07301.1 Crp/Fnr family transcriptional regulator [Filimonas lacunae]SIS91733.1 cAMP-binding domain of CRP or a regulatory subunit of cAMP-dependent protein kinases [Filimonas lacunae]